MESITLKEIVGYLPYKLKVKSVDIFENDPIFELGLETTSNIKGVVSIDWVLRDNFKPLLYPLSMLTQEIEHNGEKIIPIVELAKIALGDNYEKNHLTVINDDKFATLSMHSTPFFEKAKYIIFRFDEIQKSFTLNVFDYEFKPITTYSVKNQLQMFEKLYEWHFDVHGLIERGLAIDKSKI